MKIDSKEIVLRIVHLQLCTGFTLAALGFTSVIMSRRATFMLKYETVIMSYFVLFFFLRFFFTVLCWAKWSELFPQSKYTGSEYLMKSLEVLNIFESFLSDGKKLID